MVDRPPAFQPGGVHAVDLIRTFVESVIASLKSHILHNKEEGAQRHREPEDVDQGEEFLPEDVSPGDFEVAPDHVLLI